MFTSSARYRHYLRYDRQRRRSRNLTLALLVVLAGAVLALLQGNARPGHHRAAHHVHARIDRTRSASSSAARARLAERTAGQGLAWTGFHGIQLPVSAQAGPRHVRGGLVWGF